MNRNRKLQSCRAPSTCEAPGFTAGESPSDPTVLEALTKALREQGTSVSLAKRHSFAAQIEKAIRHRKLFVQIWKRLTQENDIICMIKAARDAGDVDEAIWRSFIAAHFGRTSASGVEQELAASRFLCAFRKVPFWTWKRVSKNFGAFKDWLFECSDELGTLRFGNHRKYESPRPNLILKTMNSFIDLVKKFGSPTKLFSLDDSEPDGFDEHYRRLQPLNRFGRTGCFDFLVLLLDMNLIADEPQRCYLRGSTGPINGARKLWGELAPRELDEKATWLADRLGVSPIVMEDCLCNWQK